MRRRIIFFLFVLAGISHQGFGQTWDLVVTAYIDPTWFGSGPCEDPITYYGMAYFGTSSSTYYDQSHSAPYYATFTFSGEGTPPTNVVSISSLTLSCVMDVGGTYLRNYDGPSTGHSFTIDVSSCNSGNGTSPYGSVFLHYSYSFSYRTTLTASHSGNTCPNQEVTLTGTSGFSDYAWSYRVGTGEWQGLSLPNSNVVGFTKQNFPAVPAGQPIFFRYSVKSNTCTSPVVGPFTFYPPAPQVTGTSITPPSCPSGANSEDGVVSIQHPSITSGEIFIYSVTQYVRKIEGQACLDVGNGTNERTFNGVVYCTGYKANFTNTNLLDFPLSNDNKTDGTDTHFTFRPGWYTMVIESKRDKDDASLSCPTTPFQFQVAAPAAMLVNLTESTPPSCAGGNNGSADFTIVNGKGPFTWRVYRTGSPTVNIRQNSTPSSSRSIPVTNLPAHNSYTIEITDTYCSLTATTTFAIGAGTTTLSISSSGISPRCLADFDNNGIVESISGSSITGTATSIPSLTYSFYLYSGSSLIDQATNLSTNAHSFSNMPPGAYYDSVKTSNGCRARSNTVTLTRPTALTSTPVPANTTCSNSTDGRITLTNIAKTQGDINYTYIITKSGDAGFMLTGPDVTSSANRVLTNSLDAGTYMVTVIDNCLPDPDHVFNNLIVNRRPAIYLDEQDDILIACYDGAVSPTITFHDGTPNYSIDVKRGGTSLAGYPRINQSSTTFQLSGIGLGEYSIIVTDACTVDDTMNFSVESDAASAVTATLTRLRQDTNNDGFTNSNDFHLSCPERNDGSIQVDVEGGIQGSGSLKYRVELLNALGALMADNGSNNNTPDGSIADGVPIGGNKVRYLISGLAENVAYQIRVTDFNPNPGTCEKVFNRDIDNNNLILSAPDALNIELPNITTDFTGLANYGGELYAICKGDSDGSYTARITGGNPSHEVRLYKKALSTDAWPSTPFASEAGVTDGTAVFSLLGVGFYNVQVTDQQGCAFTERMFEVREASSYIQADDISASIFPHGANTTCYGDSDGSITIEASGGVGDYTYLLTSDEGYSGSVTKTGASHTFPSLSAVKVDGDTITYTISVNDALGCSWNGSNGVSNLFKLSPPDTVEFSWTIISRTEPGYDIPCADDEATIRVTSEGGMYPHFVTINGTTKPITGDHDSAVFSLPAGIHTASFQDNLGCTAPDQTITLHEPPSRMVATAGAISYPVCVGNNNGQINVSASGGIQYPVGEEYIFLIRQSGAPEFDNDSLRGASVSFFRPANYFTARNYEIMSIDAHGCTDTIPVTMPVNPAPLTLTADTLASPSCHGGTDGFITVTSANHDFITGTSLLFRISGGHFGNNIIDTLVSSHSVTFQHLQGTDLYEAPYKIWIEDANSCEDTAYQFMDNLQLPSYAPLVLNLMRWIRPSCHNGADGSLLIKATGGVPPYSYSSDNISYAAVNPDSMILIPGLASGNHSFFLTDSQYKADQPTCLSDTSFFVEPGRFIRLVTDVTHVTCAGSSDGAIQLTPHVDNRNLDENFDLSRLSLHWTYDNLSSDTISTQQDLSARPGGKYTVHARYNVDSLVCTNQRSITIRQPVNGAFRISDIQTFNASCGGNTHDGRAIVTITGGWPDSISYYRVDEGQWKIINGTNFLVTYLSPGEHKVEIRQASICHATEQFVIDAAIIPVSHSVIKPSCPGNNDGIINLSSSMSGLEYAEAGSAFQPSGSFGGRTYGTYSFIARKITEPSCLSDTLSIQVHDPDSCFHGNLTLHFISSGSATCNAANDGSAEVIAAGGVAPYKYYWNGLEDNNSVDDLPVGTHEVVVVDDVNASDTLYIEITSLTGLRFESFTSKVSCSGGSDGTAEISVFEGSGNYKISWSDDNQITTFRRNTLAPGVYHFTVLDSLNEICTVSGAVAVEQHPSLSVTVQNVLPPTCPGGADGSLTAAINGGSNNYNLLWNTGATDKKLEGIVPGSYVISVTDALLGCSLTDTLALPDVNPITIVSRNITPPRCYGGNDGEIQLVLSNVSNPLVRWSHDNNLLGIRATQLRAGTYKFSITGANGCGVTDSVVVSDRPLLKITPSTIMPPCFGNCNGSAALSMEGGTKPYSIQWNHGPRTPSLKNLCAGNYSYTVTDKNGCRVTSQAIVASPAPLAIIQDTIINATCYGMLNGSISVTATGGTPQYVYSWSTGSTADEIAGLGSGTYKVTVTDVNNCISTRSFVLGAPAPLLLLNDIVIAPSCAQSADGEIIAQPSGGTAPYNYAWTDLITNDQTRTDLAAGIYQLTITDALGCTVEKTYSLMAPAGLELVNVKLKDPTCFNDTDGSISLAVIGGTFPYGYQWTHGATTPTLVHIGSGLYRLTVTDKNGCSITDAYSLHNPMPPVINGIPSLLTVCTGSTTAVAPDGIWRNYHWAGPAGFESNSSRIDVTLPGSYQLIAWDETGCPGEFTFTVEISDDALIADFLRISEAVAYEPVVFVDISNPAPQSVEWILPDDSDIVVNKQSSLNIEIVFTRADTFEIGMIASMGTCQSELYKTVVIGEPDASRGNSGERSKSITDETIQINAFPNPASDALTLKITASERESVELWLVSAIDNRKFIHHRLEGQLDYYVTWDVSQLIAGIYYIIYKQNSNTHSQRIAVIR